MPGRGNGGGVSSFLPTPPGHCPAGHPTMRPALITTIVATVVLGLVALFGGKDLWRMARMGGPEATSVRMDPAATGVLVETVSAPGIVEPEHKVDVSAEVSARIVELPHREGDRVRAGDLIMRLDDRDLKALPRVESLKELDLSQTPLRGEGLPSLARLPNLRSLSLDRGAMDDAGLGHLPPHLRLAQLSLRGTRVGGPGLAALSRLPNLNSLFLEETPLDDAGLAHLPPLPELRTLSLRNTRISVASLPGIIQRFPKLQVLELPRTPSLTREVLDELVEQTGWRVFH